MIPLVWALTWTAWLQFGRPFDWVSYHGRDRAVWVPVAIPVVAFVFGESLVYFGLIVANLLAISSLGRKISTRTRKEAVIVLGAMALAGLPGIWAEELIPFYTRGKCVLLALAAYGVSVSVRRREWRAGVVGAVLTGIATQYYFGRLDYLEQFVLDTTLMFALVHSLDWRDTRESVGRPIRFALGLGWVIHGIIWVRIAGGDVPETEMFISRMMPLSGLLVLTCFAAYQLLTRRWQPLYVQVFGLLVVLTVPINSRYEAVRITPPGYLAVLGSFVLFALGTGYAIIRDQLAARAGDYARTAKAALIAPIGDGN